MAKQASAITDALAEFLAVDLWLLSLVEGAGFRRFMAIAAPGFVVPARSTVRKILEDKKEDVQGKVLDVLKKSLRWPHHGLLDFA